MMMVMMVIMISMFIIVMGSLRLVFNGSCSFLIMIILFTMMIITMILRFIRVVLFGRTASTIPTIRPAGPPLPLTVQQQLERVNRSGPKGMTESFLAQTPRLVRLPRTRYRRKKKTRHKKDIGPNATGTLVLQFKGIKVNPRALIHELAEAIEQQQYRNAQSLSHGHVKPNFGIGQAVKVASRFVGTTRTTTGPSHQVRKVKAPPRQRHCGHVREQTV